MHSQSTFVLGTVMFVCGSLLTFVAFGFAAQSLLASLEGVQFVTNVAFARLIRKVPVTLPVVLGVVMIVGGVATVVLSGSHESDTRTSQELFELYLYNHAYQAFLVVAGGAAVVLRYTEKAYSKRLTMPDRKPWPFR
jgi:drug/metabolite transporter (DMT)-like permease